MDTDLSKFRNMHLGKSAFVVGAGPSLYGMNLRPIHKHVVLSTNSSSILMPWNSPGDSLRRIWISNDVLCVRWDYFVPYVLNANCTRLYRDSWQQEEGRFSHRDYHYFIPRNTMVGEPLAPDVGGLCSVSSVPTAIDFALLTGCKKIYLLGVDHRMIGNKTHFYHYWPKSRWPQMYKKTFDKKFFFDHKREEQEEIFHKNTVVMESLRDYARRQDAVIYNCSPISTVKTFEHMPFREAVKHA